MWFWSLHIHLLLFVMLSLAFTGCATIPPWISGREVPGCVRGIEAGDGITVVLDFQGGTSYERWRWVAEAEEERIGDYISDAMAKRNLSVRIISPGEFRRAVFPGMDITTAPTNRESILRLLDSSSFREKIKYLNLRYLIIVRKITRFDKSLRAGSFSDTSIIPYDKSTSIGADIIDLKKPADCGEVQVFVLDKGYCGCVGSYGCAFPVFTPTSTEWRARKTIGLAVTKFLLGEKTHELSK